MVEDPTRDKTALVVQRVEDGLVEPARRGVRKVGVGVGKVASGSIMAVGLSGAAY